MLRLAGNATSIDKRTIQPLSLTYAFLRSSSLFRRFLSNVIFHLIVEIENASKFGCPDEIRLLVRLLR